MNNLDSHKRIHIDSQKHLARGIFLLLQFAGQHGDLQQTSLLLQSLSLLQADGSQFSQYPKSSPQYSQFSIGKTEFDD